jgi:uncharacterized membrane protein
MAWLLQNPHLRARLELSLLLMISTAFSVALVGFRVFHSGTFTYTFFVWNLFLAFVPFAISTAVVFRERRLPAVPLFLIVGVWLLFFPNAPYILTDLFHLTPKQGVPLWYDLVLILSFAWNGLIFGLISLADMQSVLTRQYGRAAGWAFVSLSIALGSFGIYLGRYLRWNSWDLFTNPHGLLSDILERFTQPLSHPRTWGVTLLFSIFLSLCYLMLQRLATRPSEQ